MADVKNRIHAHLLSFRPPKRVKVVGAPSFWTLLKSLTFVQWMMFFSGWMAWTCDAIDFFSVSLTVNRLRVTFNESTHNVTTSITLTLLFRSVGAVIFGLASDRYGRKWPLVLNMFLICGLQIGSSFTQTFSQFLACRSLFGITMGGVWGMAAATALENLPAELRGLASGVLQQGYAVGYLIAAVVNLSVVPKHSWRSLFWVAAGLSAFAGLLRATLPESEVFRRRQMQKRDAQDFAEANGAPVETRTKTQIFIHETVEMLKRHWLLCIYAVLLMTGFNFLSHGSQDLYPTFLQDTKGFSAHSATVATIIGNCGAVAGGVVAGIISQYLGRRLTILLFILLVGCFIPLWILPQGFAKLSAGAFCLQFAVQGAWAWSIPIQLAELSPPAFRATFPGLMYQMGNMVSAASSQIEATGGDHLRTTLHGVNVPDYAKVQGILLGTVAAFTFVITFIGPTCPSHFFPRKHGFHFEEYALAFEEGGGKDKQIAVDDEPMPREKEVSVEDNDSIRRKSLTKSVLVEEKPEVRELEAANRAGYDVW
ncbi:hypothetical protein BS47DRAFT_1378376 [Hydnum rufescens UP504]|uniref:Major facilitator superfamily (MFS) profile domain-containing protein n=1 Tax=Hydnum rufescens UP504 TaxID=1448309 RepID=A0A9P6DM62_9AGAM|nr:hypothetical protein BS47DRAFT_1378376 [Hydnum rufescens UP504]